VAAHTGHLSLDERFAWLATSSALITLSVAALLEILAYYVPTVDNMLDTLATPASLAAGTVISAAVMTDVPPMVKWTAAVIAGGGIAGLTQAGTATRRCGAQTVAKGPEAEVLACPLSSSVGIVRVGGGSPTSINWSTDWPLLVSCQP
jgi:hypothetical protein